VTGSLIVVVAAGNACAIAGYLVAALALIARDES
jgi:hypothetical protein